MTEPTIRYRHRTAEVEAVQWTGSNAEVLSAFCGPDFDEIELDDRTEDPDESAAVREGKHGTWRGLRPGDWVVKLDGGLYEFAAADFAEQYEPAVPAPATDQAALRDRIAALFRHPPGAERLGDATPGEIADAVLSVLPAPADRAAVLREAAEVAVRAARGCGDSEAGQHAASVAAGIGKELRRLADETPQPETDDCCGGVPPELFIDEAGREWHAGDCWCTLAPGHGGQHRCQPCTDRVGAPGWTDEQPAVGAQQPKEAVWCSAVALRVHHAGHDWTSHPGMDPVHCVGYPQPKEA